MRPTALLVEPDRILLEQYGRMLQDHVDVIYTHTAQLAIDILDQGEAKVDVIVMDFNLGKNNGVEFLHEIRSYDDWANIPVVMMTSVPRDRLPQRKLAAYGVKRLLYKPQTSPFELLKQVQRTIVV